MVLQQKILAVQEFLMRFAASGLMPANWLFDAPREVNLEQPAGTPETIEIVSHCWNYAHLLQYQIQSLIENEPADVRVIYTVFYAPEDAKTTKLLKSTEKNRLKNIDWNFIPLDVPDLMRRAIGRNKAAKSTVADWIWFTDCDLLFGKDTFPSLVEELTGQDNILVFPETVLRTSLLDKNDELLCAERFSASDCMERDCVKSHQFEKATGPVQIVRGDVARKYGYCDQIRCYQQPKERWVKTYEDRTFRWLLGTHGQPIDVESVGIIRHVEKGRYHKRSPFSKLREANRKVKNKLLAR